MDSFTPMLILCLASFGSSIVMGASKHSLPPMAKTATTYDVVKFGAVGDGKKDDTKAFELAWEAACRKGGQNSKITAGNGKAFLVSQIQFNGPCTSTSMTFEILGNIVAPPRSEWKNKGADEWLNFHRVDGLTVVGNGQGLIDGRGATWWKNGVDNSRPTAMRFSNCNKLSIKGLKHINSQKNHVSINGCKDTTISNLDIMAPPRSPNTDGIDISGSTNLHISDCTMATGDDCIAINGGTSNVIISNITCGPGHGISIGSLGKNGAHDEVEAININNCIFNRSDNGVRIKTWQVPDLSQITFIAAKNPVIIDQYYCPHKICASKPSAVKVSEVKYYGLHGTSNGKNTAINISCSQTVPCTNIILDDVEIKSDNPNHSTSARCINAHVQAHALNPTMNCLPK